jgi:glutaminase
VNPITGEHALEARYVENVLSVMSTCGMYDYAGEWVYTVGLPAKSGVSGGVVAVLPGQLGIGVFSPPLDARGNSARGIRVCQRMAADFDLHPLRFQPDVRGVVRRTYRCKDTRSNRARRSSDYEALAARADSIAVFELQGDLFFGSTERLFRTVVDDLAGVEYVVLDCKRIGSVDASAVSLVASLRTELEAAGCLLLITDAAEAEALLGVDARAFVDTDAAVEWCENRILQGVGITDFGPVEQLAEQELLRGLTTEELVAVERLAEIVPVAIGDVVFHEGDPADAIYFVLSGLVSVRLHLGGIGRDRRLATLGAGVAVGEMAYLEEGGRSADVIAEEDSLLARVGVDDLRRLGEELPGVLAKFSANLARNLSARLRRANEQVRTLAH